MEEPRSFAGPQRRWPHDPRRPRSPDDVRDAGGRRAGTPRALGTYRRGDLPGRLGVGLVTVAAALAILRTFPDDYEILVGYETIARSVESIVGDFADETVMIVADESSMPGLGRRP